FRVISTLLLCATLVYGKDKKKQPPSLTDRYHALSCAVVQIASDSEEGSGFFINADGDLLTAAHVALSRLFSEPQPNNIQMAIVYIPHLKVLRNGHPPVALILPPLTQEDIQRAISDLVILRTGIKTTCFLTPNESNSEQVGQHVISIGYPVSAPSGALYEGFVSARYKHLLIPLAQVNNKPLYPTYDVIRVQMPITPGVSGAPVIADDNSVIGVVTEQPMIWFTDLNALIQVERAVTNNFSATASDLPRLLAELALTVKEYESPGAGLAVPASYLKAQAPRAMTPQTPLRKSPGFGSHQ
ncbi:MAG: serine protease, partial [Bryobacteraceae bacterium]